MIILFCRQTSSGGSEAKVQTVGVALGRFALPAGAQDLRVSFKLIVLRGRRFMGNHRLQM